MSGFNNTEAHDSNGESKPLIVFIRLILILLYRGGSILVQLGTFPAENVYNIIFQNIVDFAVSIVSFCIFGYTLAFGHDEYNSIFGYNSWISSNPIDSENLVYGVSSVLLGSNIITSALSGRMHFIACLIISAFYSGFFLPLTMNWTWNTKGFMTQNKYFGRNVYFFDYGGGLVVCGAAGVVGFIGSLFLGRRLLLLNDIDEASLGVESSGTTILGYFLMTVGHFALLLPRNSTAEIYAAIVNIIVTIGSGLLSVIILQIVICRKQFNFWALIRCMQSVISSMVLLSPGIAQYTPVFCIILALQGGIVFSIISRCVHISALEDYCNITSIYMMSGILGIIFPPLVANNKSKEFTYSFIWQLICTISILFIYVASFSFIFLILWSTGLLRNKSDAICHERSNFYHRKKVKTLFHHQFFDFLEWPILLEPGISNKTTRVSLRPKVINSFKRTQSAKRNKGTYESCTSTAKENIVLCDQNEMDMLDDPVYKIQDLIDVKSKESNIIANDGHQSVDYGLKFALDSDY